MLDITAFMTHRTKNAGYGFASFAMTLHAGRYQEIYTLGSEYCELSMAS
jgi:hypothetical protein